MSNLITITLNARADQSAMKAVGATLTGVNAYDAGLTSETLVTILGLTTDEVNALYTIIDKISYAFEASANIIVVVRGEHSLDFSNSYVRNAVSTMSPAALPSGVNIAVRFEFSGFVENEVCDVVFQYGTGFSGSDLALLTAAGVSVTVPSGGKSFSFTNTRQCMVNVYKPVGETSVYAFSDPGAGQIISKS